MRATAPRASSFRKLYVRYWRRRRAPHALFPDIDAAIGRQLIDCSQLVIAEVELSQGAEAVFELLDRARADERRCHTVIPQHPRDRHLREGLATATGDIVQAANAGEVVFREHLPRDRSTSGDAGPLGNAVEVLVA